MRTAATAVLSLALGCCTARVSAADVVSSEDTTVVPQDGGTTEEGCPETCLFETCEHWVSKHVQTCAGLELSGCDCRGCDCGGQPSFSGFWLESDNIRCGVGDLNVGTVKIGTNGAQFDIMEVSQCMEVCESSPECGGINFNKAELKCTYVADPSVYQSQDPWSACYTLNLPDDGDSTLSTTLSLLTTTPPPVVNDGSNSDGGVQPKATAKPKATPKPKGTTTTTKLQEPTATKTTTTKPVVVDEDTTSRGSTCGSGCIQPDRTCEDWADYYTCGELESKVGCDCSGCSCAVDCVGEWSAWAECDVTCGTGRTSRSFMVLVDAAFGGEECAFSRGEIQTRECSIVDPDAPASGDTVLHCPISCVGHWSSWGACSVTCGTGGTRKRIFAVETQPKYGGEACPISQTNGCNGVDDCVCPRTCIAIGYSCDDWMSTSDAWTCAGLETDEYGCDCNGCDCNGSQSSSDSSDLDCENPTCTWWACQCPS